MAKILLVKLGVVVKILFGCLKALFLDRSSSVNILRRFSYKFLETAHRHHKLPPFIFLEVCCSFKCGWFMLSSCMSPLSSNCFNIICQQIFINFFFHLNERSNSISSLWNCDVWRLISQVLLTLCAYVKIYKLTKSN